LVKKFDLILYYGLFVLSFVMPISIAATNIVWISLFLVWIIKIILRKSEDLSSPVTYAILIFFGTTVVFSLFGIDVRQSLKKVNSELLFLVFFLVLANVRDFKHAKKIMLVFLISSAIMGLLGLAQYLIGRNVFDLDKVPESKKLLNYISLLNFRAHGTRSWAQTYAESLLMALPAAIFMFLHSKKKYFYPIILFVFLGIFFSYVRMVWISTAVIMLVVSFWYIKRLKKLVYIVLAVCLLIVISNRFIDTRRDIVKRATNFSDPVRTAMWKTSFEIFKDHPVFGVGFANVKKLFPYYYRKLKLPKEDYKLSHLHSSYIHILVERGVIVFLVFLFLYGAYFYYGIRKAKNTSGEERFFILGCLFAMLGFMLSGLTEYAYGDPVIRMIMWFFMALTFYKSRAVFLDRDGTINKGMHYSADERKLKILKGSYPAVKLLNDTGYKVIIVTNQSGVARGKFYENDVKKINGIIVNKLKKKGAVINGVYFCPHHPEENCECRKPEPGLIMRAKKDFNIDIRNSYVIGDMQSDVDLAGNIGAKSIFVLTGNKKRVKNANYTAKDILDAAKWIVKKNKSS